MMTLAKSLGGGLVPLGAMLARRDLWMKAYGI
jgi:acetylornithine/succinyldiaminopimelate/putrescine aminotransferase